MIYTDDERRNRMPDNKDNEERRNEFMDAAEKLFKENGIVDTTINSIVRELDVAKGLFYYYFRSKEDVIDAISEKYNEVFRESMRTAMDKPDYDERLKQYMENCIRSFRTLHTQLQGKEEADLSPLISRSLKEARSASENGLTKLLKEGISRGEFEMKYPQYYAKILTGGIITLIKEEEDDEVIASIMDDLMKRLGKEEENV